MSENDIAGLLRTGVEAARNGERVKARGLLQQVLEQDEVNELAWLWMASVVDTPRERRICLENVLELNPNNPRARQELERLDRQVTGAPPSSEHPAEKPPPKPSTVRRDVLAATQTPPRRSTQRRTISPLMIALGSLLLLVLLFGLALILNVPTATTTPTPVPTRTLSFIALQQTLDAQTKVPTATARGTVETLEPRLGYSTWTPQPTFTAPASYTPTATAFPIELLTLTFAGEGRGRTNIGLYTMRGDGGGEHLLITGDARAFDEAWSPDGKRIAYITVVEGKEQLAVADSDGSNVQVLSHFGGSHTRTPSWSADGAQLVVMSDDGGQQALYTLNVDGSNLKKLTDDTIKARDPAWSPDGKKIVYAADSIGQGAYQLYALDLAAGTSEQLTESQNSNYGPAWSPDGSRIAFISTRDNRANVYSMNADGSDPQVLTFQDNTGENRDPAWSPDGRLIVFSSNREGGVFNLYVMFPDGSGQKAITQQKSATIKPRIRPGS